MDCLAKDIEVFLAIARFLLEIRDSADAMGRPCGILSGYGEGRVNDESKPSSAPVSIALAEM
jgi:hypothetical protein